MRRTITALMALCFVAATAQSQQSAAAKVSPATVDSVLKAVRADLQSSRADIMSKNLTLTAEQAAKFWPAFEAYQKEQNVIMDAHIKGVQKYAESYETLDDAGALVQIDRRLSMVTQVEISSRIPLVR